MLSEKIIINEGGKYPLNGILMLPEKDQPVPAVVLVHGSGSSNMDEKVMKLTPFKDLAEGLCKYGIASIRYDKRSYVYGMKMIKEGNITVKEETIDDALMAIEILKNDQRIDKDRIYILGHSMGAMLSPRIDAEGGDVKGLIMMAGTPYRLEDIVIRQLKQASQSSSLMKLIGKLELRIFGKKFDNLYQLSEEEAMKKKFAGSTTLYYFQEMGRKTAADYLLESDKPVLIMQGGKDFQVLADDDFAKFKTILAGRPNTVFRLYPELNHCFVQAMYSDILKVSKEYSTERHISDEVIKDIADFIQ